MLAVRRPNQTRRAQGGAPRLIFVPNWASVRLCRLLRWLLALELLAGLFRAALQLGLELLLLLLEYFWIGRGPVVGLGKVAQWDDQADRLAGAVDALDHEALPLLQFADQFAARL